MLVNVLRPLFILDNLSIPKGDQRLLTVLKTHLKENSCGNFLVLQCLELCTSTAGGTDSVPGWRTKIAQAKRRKKKG